MEEEKDPEGSRRDRNHRALLLFIPLAVSVVLRLYPSLYNGAPWGTDGWPLIHIANEILLRTPAPLTASTAFGHYDIYWPAASLYGAIASLIFNAQPIVVMQVIIPLAGATTTLFLFAIVERITRSSKIACAASLIFTTASFDSIFTASVTKETFGEPLFMAGILIALVALFADQEALASARKTSFAAFALITLALAMAHHATSAIFALVVLALSIGRALVGVGYGSSMPIQGRLGVIVGFPLISSGIVGSYLLVYALAALPIVLTTSEAIYFASFLVLSLSVGIYFALEKGPPSKSNFFIPVLIFLVGVSLFVLSEFIHLFPLAPVIPTSLAFDSIPYLISGGLVLFGYAFVKKELPRASFTFLAMWIAVPIALFGFATFVEPDQAVNVYRLFTFLYAPVSLLAAVALVPYLKDEKNKRKTTLSVARAGGALLIVAIVILGVIQSYSAVVQDQNLLGGQWAYRPSDISSASWVDATNTSNLTLAGDTKIAYLFSDYFGVSINTELGFRYLTASPEEALSGTPLVTYASMNQNGYNLFLYGEPLPAGWQNSLANHSSLVYDNGNVEVWS